MEGFSQVVVNQNTNISSAAFEIKFNRLFSFHAGQFVGITVDEKITPRLYSLASSPSEEQVSILFSVKDDGLLTPRLAKLKTGDKIWVSPVQGKFIYTNEPAWWIATGTGIAPFRAMYRSGSEPLKLIQGGRKKEDIFYYNEFLQMPDYVVCCSQDSGENIYQGRLTSFLKNYDNLPQSINYYICGNAEMVVDVRNLLINRGIPYHQIITEIYF